jgi:hypothetical protein
MPVGGTRSRVGEQRRPPVWVLRTFNPVVRTVLQSPLHSLLSGRLLLLRFTGRRSSRVYTVPIGWFSWDRGAFSISARSWWVNLTDERPVQLLVRGRWVEAVPRVASEPREVADLLGEFATRKGPKAARGLLLGLPSDRLPTRGELEKAAPKTAVILFDFAD